MVDIRSFAQKLSLNDSGLPDDIGIEINSSELFANAWQSLPPELLAKINILLNIGKWILIAILAYIVIKIIYQLVRFRDGKNLKIIAKNVREINSKMDLFIHKKSEKKEDKE